MFFQKSPIRLAKSPPFKWRLWIFFTIFQPLDFRLPSRTIFNLVHAMSISDFKSSEKRSTTLLQAKTGKYECRNVTMWLLHFTTRAYLFSPDEGSCCIFSTRNNCCEFLASYGVIIQSVIQSYLKTPVCGASLSYQISSAYLN